jgi:hypothetical protein
LRSIWRQARRRQARGRDAAALDQHLWSGLILKDCGAFSESPTLQTDDSVTFRWFVKERCIPMRQGKWSPAYRKTNTYHLEHYLIGRFGDLPLSKLDAFQIQIWLNGLVEKGLEKVR